MSAYLDYINYFAGIAKLDPFIRHDQLIAGTNDKRNSFFSVSDPDELDAADFNYIHYPFVAQAAFSGTMKDTGNYQIMIHHELRFYTKALSDNYQQPAIESAYDLTYEIMQQWLNLFLKQSYGQGSCGPIHTIDIDSIRFTKLEQLADLFFGWSLSFIEHRPVNKFLQPNNYWQ